MSIFLHKKSLNMFFVDFVVFKKYYDSISKKLWPLGDDTVFVPGHGPTSQFGYERKTNPFVSDAALAAAG